MGSLLRVSELSYSYGAKQILKGVSFEVGAGEIFGLLGRNGSGKSTLLSLLSGIRLMQPGRGQLEFQGQPLALQKRAYREQLGVVFQNPSLDAKLTAAENLRLAARLFGLNKANANIRVAECLELAGLTSLANEPVRTFSGGMKRRLDVVRALVHKPKLLLLDEPTSGVDAQSFQSIWQTLSGLCQHTGMSIVVASHRPDEAEMCGTIALIHEGSITALGTPEVLKSRLENDVISLLGEDPAFLLDDVARRFKVNCLREGNTVFVETRDGHTLIPRLVEAYPAGTLQAVGLRQASMADVFLKLTGQALSS